MQLQDSNALGPGYADNGYNVADQYRYMTTEQIKDAQTSKALPFAVACLHVQYDINISNIVRSSCINAAERFFIIGRRKFDRRGMVGAQNYIDIVKYQHTGTDGNGKITKDQFYRIMNEYEYTPIFVEQGGNSIWNTDFSTFSNDNRKFCIVFGSEHIGVDPDISAGQMLVSIPQRGVLRSYNVSSAAAIVLAKVLNDLTN